jgi:hypothetical protein
MLFFSKLNSEWNINFWPIIKGNNSHKKIFKKCIILKSSRKCAKKCLLIVFIFQDWNDQLADIAHGWALQCTWRHNPDRSAGVNGYVGENLAVFTSIYIFCCAHSTRFFNEIWILLIDIFLHISDLILKLYIF